MNLNGFFRASLDVCFSFYDLYVVRSTTTTPRSVRRSTAWTEDDASIVPFVCFPFASYPE